MERRSCTLVVALLFAVVAQGCGAQPTRTPFVFWTPTSEATQTPVLLTVISTKVVQITVTPEPTPEPTDTPRQIKLCVVADEAVHLRAGWGINYPAILQLPNGAEVVSLGGRNKNWLYVQYQDKAGWVNGKFIGVCDE